MKVMKLPEKRIRAKVYYRYILRLPKNIGKKFMNKELSIYEENEKIIIEAIPQ